MKIFSLHTIEQRHRTHRIAARDAAAAERALKSRLPRGARIIERAVAVDIDADASSAEAAISHLLSTDFLPLDAGIDAKIEDWVLHARSQRHLPATLARINAGLGPVGLRVSADDQLWIGSAASVPAIGLIFEGTEWAGTGLTSALRHMTGAQLSNMTFAGKRARAVGLPLAVVFAVQPQEATQ